MKILIVEDEPKVLRFISQALREAGWVVDGVENLSEAEICLKTNPYDLLILDRLLRGKDSIRSLAYLKKIDPNIKLLVLSALQEVDDKVLGLDQGADDYLGKPFSVTELIARVRALLRRPQAQTHRSSRTANQLNYQDLSIDLESQKVTKAKKRLDLTGKEFRILVLLAQSPGKVFSKTALLEKVWDMNHIPGSNVVEVTIANLRGKMNQGQSPLIHSRRGVGYWFGNQEVENIGLEID